MSKFWQKKYISKYTGAEIDAAVGKADTVPAVTAADAGSALVVDEEGKIVTGEVGNAPGDYTITATELDSVAIALGTAVAAATDKLQLYSFDIPNTDPGYESINAIIENICAHPGFNYISIMGSSKMLVYTTDEHTIKTGPVSYSGAELHFWLRGTVNDEITIEMTTQKINMT